MELSIAKLPPALNSISFKVMFSSSLILASNLGYTAPVGDNSNIVSGSGSISVNGTNTQIDQLSQNIAIDWDSFNISSGESVTFAQPNSDSIALNRDFSGSPSQLFGNLSANGHVFLLNTAGVLIGSGASLNVGSLLVSDLNLSDQATQEFGDGSDAGTLSFTDADLEAGGITVLGSISSVGGNGISLLGQYVRLGSDILSNNGNITIKIGGSAVLVTDPNGLYGIELADPVVNDISPSGELYGYVDNPMLIQAINGDIVRHVRYQSNLEIVPVANEPDSGNVRIQTIAGRIVNPLIESIPAPLTVSPEEQSDVDDTITDSLHQDETEQISTLAGDTPRSSKSSLDNLMQDCVPQDPSDSECRKKNAIKRYLGRLLIGGSPPD